MGKRLAYGLAGYAGGIGLGIGIALVLGKNHIGQFLNAHSVALMALGLGGSTIATYVAQKRGKVKSIDEIKRPLTLFSPENSK